VSWDRDRTEKSLDLDQKNTGGSGFIKVFKFLATETVPKLEVQRNSDGCALAL
jgi:hypothetical protein